MPDTVSRTPPGALPYCEAVCTGYLSTFALVMQRLGIQSKIIGPQDMLRTRNVTRIDGSWYHSGVTWDDMHESIGPQRFHSMMSEQTPAPIHAKQMRPPPQLRGGGRKFFHASYLKPVPDPTLRSAPSRTPARRWGHRPG